MRHFQRGLATLIFVSSTLAGSSDPFDLIRRVSENYHHLRSFEFAGHLTTTIPGTEFEALVEALDAEAGHSFVPESSSLVKYGEAKSLRNVTITDSKGNHPGPNSPLQFVMPSHWGSFERMDVDVKSVTELPSETVEFDGTPVECRVVQVAYDREKWRPEELTVKYWIDQRRLLVLKEDFLEQQGRERPAVFWHWVYTVDSVKLNQPPPEWLVDFTNHLPADHPRPEWVGRTAPNFRLSDLDGHQVDSRAMHGEVVVLDFWATWCRPCKEEVPIVEKISKDYKSQGVEVWGVSLDEEPSIVKTWTANNQTNFQTAIDPEHQTAGQYDIKSIPALIVIGRTGKIVSYYEGNQTEQSLRSAIDLALHKGPTNNP
jgi:peroxiredoxin